METQKIILVGFFLSVLSKEAMSQEQALTQAEHTAQLDKITCGNLLTRYAAIPTSILEKIHFVTCTENKKHQMGLAKAIYSVDAQNSVQVENYFSTTYGITKMKWNEKCHDGMCILSNNMFGMRFEPQNIHTLYEIDKELLLSFKMSGMYDYYNHTLSKSKTLNDRSKIKQFTIEISIDHNP
ncbi:MAG: DUF4952 domain-containing protein [Gammaproteobacteria bacterium]|nr:DUF4952 domain-containing protein [Gammaproteobacteria bacterium]